MAIHRDGDVMGLRMAGEVMSKVGPGPRGLLARVRVEPGAGHGCRGRTAQMSWRNNLPAFVQIRVVAGVGVACVVRRPVDDLR